MAEAKTKPTEVSVESFLDKLSDENVRNDCYSIIQMMEGITGEKAQMWGTAIIGSGSYHFKYDTGREGDICLVGFSPRKANITLYVLPGSPNQTELLSKLGKYKTGKSCLYIKSLADVDTTILKKLMADSAEFLKQKHQN